jgi:hypothetical protein
MKLTDKLLGYLNRVFNKGPERVLVIRLRYDGSMRWSVSDGVLTTEVTGGSGAPLRVDLAGYTVATLAAFLAAQPGYSVPFVDALPVPGLKATVLIDGSSNQDGTNGDHLYAYTSVLWAYMEAQASELKLLAQAVDEALLQMAANTASGEWVDEHGSFYAVGRNNGESDAAYAARIVAEVGRARGTNVAISDGVRRATGADRVDVIDYATETVAAGGTKSFGLFEVEVFVDVNAPLSGEQIDANTRAIIEAMRDAGTHLRKLKYIRKSPLTVYSAAYLSVGWRVGIGTADSPLLLDGTWLLNGDQTLDGTYD